MGTFAFKKSERLYKKKSIQELFSKGSSFYLYPFKVQFCRQDAGPNQILISVSKRNFKRAVDRNQIKRCVREAYRLSKPLFPEEKNFQIAYIYTAREILDVNLLQQKIQESFKRLGNL